MGVEHCLGGKQQVEGPGGGKLFVVLEEQQEGQFGNTENKNEDRSLGNEAGEVVRGQAEENLEDFGFDSKYHN